MATTDLVNCDICGNIILAGEVLSYITKGILVYDDGTAYVEEQEDSPVLHYCNACSLSLAATLREAAESSALEEALAATDNLGCNDCPDAPCTEACGETEEDIDPKTIAGSSPLTEFVCTNSAEDCCPTCGLEGRCCAGFRKPEPAPNFRGFGVTQEEFVAACDTAGLPFHAAIAAEGDEEHTAEECGFEDQIREAIAKNRAG